MTSRRLTHKQKLGKALKNIRESVSANDREKCMKVCKISSNTLSGYLNGNVLDPDTAVKILSFLKKRIQERELLINN